MILPLGLWLCCIGFTSQQHCSSPGGLPAPQIFLDKVSSHPGETVLLKCKVPALSRFTYVIFCKDGQDLTVQPTKESRFAYSLHHKVRANSSGNFTCLYQHIDGQMKNSFLSAAWYLNVPANISQANNSSSGMQPSCKEYKIAVTKAGALKISQTAPQGNKDIDGSYESLNAITMEDTPYSTLPMMDVSALPTSEHQPNVPFYEEAGDFATQMFRCSSSESDGYEG
ncbi:unnamed protein product [Natator depressus]